MSNRTKILAHCFKTIINFGSTPPPKPKRRLPGSFKRVDIGEITEITEILDGSLYLSGAAPLTAEKLASMGITTVVCALTEIEERHVVAPSYANMPLRKIYVRLMDSHESDLSIYFDPVSEIIEHDIKRGGKVLVHCLAGVSRSPSLIMAYLIRYQGLNLRDAYDYVAERRRIIDPNEGFVRQLLKYEKICNENRKTSFAKALSGDKNSGGEKIEFPMATIVEETIIAS